MAGQVGGRIRGWVPWVALVVSTGLLVARAELKGGARMYDFAVEYAAASAWVQGLDAYDMPAMRDLWRDAGGARGVREMPAFQRSNLPPTTLTALSPVALMPSWWAAEFWVLAGIALVAAATLAAGDLAGFFDAGAPIPARTSVPLLLAAVLASGPVQSGIVVGQVAIPASCLAVIGVWCGAGRLRRPVLAGALIGLAAALKPPVGAAFVAYYVWRREWKVALAATAVVTMMAVVGVARLQMSGTPWLAHWLDNMASGFVPGAVNDYGVGNPTRDHLVNVQVLLDWPLGGSRRLIGVVAAVVALGLAAVWAVLAGRRPVGGDGGGRAELLAVAALAAIGLVPVYHRYYDLAAPLMLAAAWAVAEWRGGLRWYAKLMLAVMALLLLPVGWQTNLLHRGRLLGGAGGAWWWHGLVEPLYAGVLLALCACLLRAMAVRARVGAGEVNRIRTPLGP